MTETAETFELALPPDGAMKVMCWTSQKEVIYADIEATGTVILVRSAPDSEVFDRIAPNSQEADFHRANPGSKRVG